MQKKNVLRLLEQKSPDLEELVVETLKCIQEGLKYPEFLSLFALTRKLLIEIADLSYMLNQHGFIEEEELPNLFFTIE